MGVGKGVHGWKPEGQLGREEAGKPGALGRGRIKTDRGFPSEGTEAGSR